MDRLPEFKRLDVDEDHLVISDKSWVMFLDALRNEPGIVVTSATRDGEDYIVSGLKDPLAIDPLRLASTKFNLDSTHLRQHWEPYHALDARLSLRRLQEHVEFPKSITYVDLQMESGKLVLKGKATLGWLQKLQQAMDLLGTGETIDISQLDLVDG